MFFFQLLLLLLLLLILVFSLTFPHGDFLVILIVMIYVCLHFFFHTSISMCFYWCFS